VSRRAGCLYRRGDRAGSPRRRYAGGAKHAAGRDAEEGLVQGARRNARLLPRPAGLIFTPRHRHHGQFMAKCKRSQFFVQRELLTLPHRFTIPEASAKMVEAYLEL
jgi:hypothetical protein